jgi:hypothetical protein
VAGEFPNQGETKMKTIKTIPPEVAAIIPCGQLYVTKKNLLEFQEAIGRLEIAVKLCPPIGASEHAIEHPAIFHYFFGGSDFYVCEYDPKDGLMFGYGILNGDLPNSEWGYFSVSEFTSSKYLNIDYHFPVQTIEAALYTAYPKHFKKPQSLAA